MRTLALVLLNLILWTLPAQAQLWSGMLDPSRAIDWSNAGIQGGIPNRTTICQTLNPGATAAQINSAITTCPSGQVVKLNAGTYNLSGGITFGGKSNVTLRGAGPDQTIINMSGETSCGGQGASICLWNQVTAGPAWGSYTGTANWTAGYAKGTTQITLSNTTSLAVGNMIWLDQLNDSSDTGGIFNCNPALSSCANGSTGGAGRPGREQLQVVHVTAINGSTVSISPGLYMSNWRSGQSPGAWWTGTPIRLSGVEDLTINHTNATGLSGIFLFNSDQCWVKNVRSVMAPRNHVWIDQSSRAVVRDSYFYDGKSHSSQSYGIEAFMAGDNLTENNIIHKVTAPFQNLSVFGQVVSYNFSFNDQYDVNGWMQADHYYHEKAGMNLHEGNDGIGLIADNVHGSCFLITVFRNYFRGWEPTKFAQTIPIHLYGYSRAFNVIGNVLGRATYHDTYQDIVPTGPQAKGNTSIYALGWGGNGGQSGSTTDDSLTVTSLLRWGNYDIVTSTSRFVSAEIPTTGITYVSGNPVPATQTLPSSFYLSARPSWWGTMPWPSFGPDVTGGDSSGTGGHAWRNPAHVCYDNSAKDANGYLTNYNATSCYGGGGGGDKTPPAAPVNLRIQ